MIKAKRAFLRSLTPIRFIILFTFCLVIAFVGYKTAFGYDSLTGATGTTGSNSDTISGWSPTGIQFVEDTTHTSSEVDFAATASASGGFTTTITIHDGSPSGTSLGTSGVVTIPDASVSTCDSGGPAPFIDSSCIVSATFSSPISWVAGHTYYAVVDNFSYAGDFRPLGLTTGTPCDMTSTCNSGMFSIYQSNVGDKAIRNVSVVPPVSGPTRILELIEPPAPPTHEILLTPQLNLDFKYYENNATNTADQVSVTITNTLDGTIAYQNIAPIPTGIQASGGVVEATTTINFDNATSTYALMITLSGLGDPCSGLVCTRYQYDATSTTFDVFAEDQATYLLGIGATATSTYPLATTTCNAFNIGGCVQNALVFLFYPSQPVLNQWGTLQPLLSSKAPVGYVYEGFNAIEGVTTTEATSTGFSWGGADGVLASPTFATFRDELGAILGFWFLVWFYRRVSKIHL